MDARWLRQWPLALLLVPIVAAILVLVERPDIPIRGARYWTTAWGAAALWGLLYVVVARRGARQGIGMALMLVTVTTTLLSIFNDLAPLIAGGTVLRAYSEYQLSSLYSRKILTDLGYLGAGFLLWSGWRWDEGLEALAQRLRPFVPAGGRSEGASLRIGVAWFPVLLLGSYLIQIIVSQNVPQLVNSDESSVWDNVTPWHGLMISAAAALGEEAVYRVLMMGGLATILMRRMDARRAWWIALAVQAIVFGFAHAGFGNWLHVLQATLFGVVSGAAALLFGIWCAIALHFLIDVYAIGGHAEPAWWIVLLVVGLIANAAYSAWVGGRWLRGRIAPQSLH